MRPDSASLTQELADFKVVQELGRGSFGTVYKAKWRGKSDSSADLSGLFSAEHVVLKRIEFRPWHQEKHRTAAKKEVQMLSKVKYPNIIQYYGSFHHKNSLFIVMEYANSGDLHGFVQKRQKKKETVPEALLWHFAEQLVGAIA